MSNSKPSDFLQDAQLMVSAHPQIGSALKKLVQPWRQSGSVNLLIETVAWEKESVEAFDQDGEPRQMEFADFSSIDDLALTRLQAQQGRICALARALHFSVGTTFTGVQGEAHHVQVLPTLHVHLMSVLSLSGRDLSLEQNFVVKQALHQLIRDLKEPAWNWKNVIWRFAKSLNENAPISVRDVLIPESAIGPSMNQNNFLTYLQGALPEGVDTHLLQKDGKQAPIALKELEEFVSVHTKSAKLTRTKSVLSPSLITSDSSDIEGSISTGKIEAESTEIPAWMCQSLSPKTLAQKAQLWHYSTLQSPSRSEGIDIAAEILLEIKNGQSVDEACLTVKRAQLTEHLSVAQSTRLSFSQALETSVWQKDHSKMVAGWIDLILVIDRYSGFFSSKNAADQEKKAQALWGLSKESLPLSGQEADLGCVWASPLVNLVRERALWEAKPEITLIEHPALWAERTDWERAQALYAVATGWSRISADQKSIAIELMETYALSAFAACPQLIQEFSQGLGTSKNKIQVLDKVGATHELVHIKVALLLKDLNSLKSLPPTSGTVCDVQAVSLAKNSEKLQRKNKLHRI